MQPTSLKEACPQSGFRVGSARCREWQRPAGNFGQALGVDRWHLIELDQNDLISSVVTRYAADPNVEMATPDWRAFPLVEPNDPLHSAHWGHDNNGQMLDYCWLCGGHDNGSPVGNPGFDANTEDAWERRQGFGDSAVVIAILDSGVDQDHPDLRLIAGWDYGDGDSNPDDDSLERGHGTACAGVAAAISNNGIGPAGAAGGVSIMPLKSSANINLRPGKGMRAKA